MVCNPAEHEGVLSQIEIYMRFEINRLFYSVKIDCHANIPPIVNCEYLKTRSGANSHIVYRRVSNMHEAANAPFAVYQACMTELSVR